MKCILTILIFALLFCSCHTADYYFKAGKHSRILLDSYKAIGYLKKSIKMDNKNNEAYYELAKAYGQTDSILPQILRYDTLILREAGQKELGQLYYLKANALYLMSADKEACRFWTKARDLNVQKAWDKIRINCN